MEVAAVKTQGTYTGYPPRRRWLDLLLLPLLFVLTLLEPIVNRLCAVVFFFGVLASVAFEISAAGPQFPFVTMMSISIGALIFLGLYHLLLAALMRD
jgi:hypothetical protein